MLNKKLLTIFSFVTILSSSNVFAKTEGNYFGVDFIRSNAKFKSNGELYGLYGNVAYNAHNTGYEGHIFRDAGNGLGLNYKYAFNLGNNVFIAPGIFFERNNLKADMGGQMGQIKIKNRRGIKLDFGYDLDDKSALYLTTGLGQISYSSEVDTIPGALGSKIDKFSNRMFYGIGLAHNISKDLAANLEFTTQRAKIDSGFGGSFKTDLRVVKVGASYRF